MLFNIERLTALSCCMPAVFSYLVPTFFQLLHDYVYVNLKGIKIHSKRRRKKKTNISLISLMALLWGLEIFKEIKSWKLFPFWKLCQSCHVLLLGGVSGHIEYKVKAMYAIMAKIGLFYSWKHSIEWNAS